MIQQGNRDALAEVYARYVDMLFNYGFKICKDTDLASDAIQDLFIDIWRYRKNIRSTDSVRFYLYYSLRSKIFKHSSATARLLQDGIGWEDVKGLVTESAEDTYIENEQLDESSQRMQKYLQNLSPRQYEAIVLRFYDNLSFEEVGKLMDMNPQSVRNLIQRGIAQLRQYVKLLLSTMLFAITQL